MRSNAIYYDEERRRYPRIPFGYVVKYRLCENCKKKFRKGSGKNISLGGILIEGKRRLPVDTLLEIEVLIPKSRDNCECIKVIGQVVRVDIVKNSRLYDLAVKFVEIPEKDNYRLLKFINAVFIST